MQLVALNELILLLKKLYIHQHNIDQDDLNKIKEGRDIETEIIRYYHKAINPSENQLDQYPLLEALSLMGNLISYDDDEINRTENQKNDFNY